jgi:hypothetical protein
VKRFFVAHSIIALLFGCASATPELMTQESLASHIEEIASGAAISQNLVEFRYEGVGIACVSDGAHDRMRLISPITQIAGLDAAEAARLEILLIANFHTTLDARYAISDGVIYAAFLHPLSTLTRPQLESAIRQVASLSLNFGSSYSSGELTFGADRGREIQREQPNGI